MAEQDEHNFSSSSPHRLPTLSASEALRNLSAAPRKPIPTGLPSLDAVLQGKDGEAVLSDLPGGVSRGEVTEVYGPPGAGKTAFSMQVAASVLRARGSVVWIDTSYKLVASRLIDCLGQADDRGETDLEPSAELANEQSDKFHHFTTPTLPHLLALLAHTSETFPPSGTDLLVVDAVSTLFALAFPKTLEHGRGQQPPGKKIDATQWASSRRWTVMGDFIAKVSKLAATLNFAVLLVSQTTTRVRQETGAVLYPAISGTAWDGGIANRVMLFQDWLSTAGDGRNADDRTPARFAGVIKAKGVAHGGVGELVAFAIGKDGLGEIMVDQSELKTTISPVLPTARQKRKREEIGDSESENEGVSDHEFGWGADDETFHAESHVGREE